MPCRWTEGPLAEFSGRVRFSRRFGLPRQIDPHERVWLTLAGGDARGLVSLNGKIVAHLEATVPSECEVTSLLQERNQLTIEVEVLEDSGELFGEVALEIRCTAFLRGLRTWNTTAGNKVYLHIAGEVAGYCEGPLELYAVLDRRNIAYQQVQIRATGVPFQMDCDPVAAEPGAHTLRVDLVQGPTVWHMVEQLVMW